jgi:hypothetical protein
LFSVVNLFFLRTIHSTRSIALSAFFNPHSAIRIPHFCYRLVTNTLKPIWESFSATFKANSFVSNWPTLTR